MSEHQPARRTGAGRRLTAVAAAAATVAVVAAGCGESTTSSSSGPAPSSAGPASSSPVRPFRTDSIDGRVGSLDLLHVHVDAPPGDAHPAGENAPLLLTLSNKGTAEDTLTSVVSPDAEQVIYRDGTGSAQDEINVAVRPGQVYSLQALGGPHLELVGLRRDKAAPLYATVVFQFEEAGTVKLKVPVSNRDTPAVSTPSASG